MRGGWIKRRAHARRLPGGGITNVRACWVFRPSGADAGGRGYRHECPKCGAPILSVNMPNGGWAHFEGRKGLSRIRHPCLHLGEGMSARRDPQTPDLFAKEPAET